MPLVGFFFLAPILFVIFHAYVLLQVLLLGRTAAAYNEALEHNIKVAADNARVRQRLANTLFAQIFAGSPRERNGWLGFLLKAMAWITLAIAPVLILFVFQFQFLPYHSAWVTWAIRILIVIDLAIILVLWPAARDPGHEVTLRGVFRQWVALPVAIVVAAFAWIVLTFPGERHAEWTRYWPNDVARSDAAKLGNGQECGTVSPIFWVSASFDRLYLLRVDVVDDEKLAKIKIATAERKLKPHQGERTRDKLSDRDLNCSVLFGADLRRVDLANARLRSANLSFADLDGASLDFADLQGASLDGARLRGTSLDGARLQGASLDGAQLQGAILHFAQLQGASLDRVQLQGASLDGARLQGASLHGAQLQGSSLQRARLQGASLNFAQLQGASLDGAWLQGASLERAQLQGADLRTVALIETAVSKAAVWRTRNAECGSARVQRARFSAIIQFVRDNIRKSIWATPKSTAKFIDDAVDSIPDANVKQEAAYRMHAGLIIKSAKDNTAKVAEVWRKCEEESAKVSQAELDKKNATFLRDLVCESKESPAAIAKGIIRNWISYRDDRRDFSVQLARGLLGANGKPCAATKDLDKEDIEKLRNAITAAPSAPTPTAPVPAPPAGAATSSPTAAAPAPDAAPAAAAAPAPPPSRASRK